MKVIQTFIVNIIFNKRWLCVCMYIFVCLYKRRLKQCLRALQNRSSWTNIVGRWCSRKACRLVNWYRSLLTNIVHLQEPYISNFLWWRVRFCISKFSLNKLMALWRFYSTLRCLSSLQHMLHTWFLFVPFGERALNRQQI